MRALVKKTSGRGLELADVADPVAGEADVTIRVLRTGICGTDLHIESWDPWAASTIVAPLVPGHEFSGEVIAVGSGVRDVPQLPRRSSPDVQPYVGTGREP